MYVVQKFQMGQGWTSAAVDVRRVERPIFWTYFQNVMTQKRQSKRKFILPFVIQIYLYLYCTNILIYIVRHGHMNHQDVQTPVWGLCHTTDTSKNRALKAIFFGLNLYLYLSLFILYKHLNIVRHEPLTFRLPFGGSWHTVDTSQNRASEAVFLDVVMGGMTPKRESKRQWFMSTYIQIYVCTI